MHLAQFIELAAIKRVSFDTIASSKNNSLTIA